MNSTDIFFITEWFLIIFLVGLPFLPFTATIFSSFSDKGYIFSKILGIALLSYVVFLLGIFHILPFSQHVTLFTLFILTIVFNIATVSKGNKQLYNLIKEKKYIFIFEEALFFIGLIFWSWIRTYSPDIHGLEKFMDFGFINSLLRSDYFPPKDMWFTPFSINYYYFGHIITAILTKLSGIPSSITFNLMLATIFSFCFCASFSIGANMYTFLVKDKFSKIKFLVSGLLSSLLVSFSGNLHVFYSLFASYDVTHPKPFWQMVFSPQTFPNAYWYPNATRFIFNTIHEFPMYSWVVSDLHGHVLDIPFVLLILALLLAIFFKEQLPEKINTYRYGIKQNIFLFFSRKEILVGFLLAVMYMTNAWDGLIYLFFASIIFAFTHVIRDTATISWNIKHVFKSNVIQKILSSCITLFVSFVGFSFPFSYFFKPFVSGIGILSAPQFLVNYGKIGPFLFEANHTQHSPWWQLLILYGFFLFFITSYFIFMALSKQKRKIDAFIILLILLSALLIFIPEIIYVKDIYPEHYRANTMFKLVFQAFIILSLVSGFVITRLLLAVKKHILSKLLFVLFFVITCVLLIGVFSYPYFAIGSYYNNLQRKYSLDGTRYLKDIYPDDYATIQWLQKNVAGQPVILEAQGDSYTDYARISSNTGLPTILGWTVHEWLWRGTYDVPAPRITEIKTLYESESNQKTKDLIKKYNVRYIYIGELEQQKYQVNLTNLTSLGRIVFKENNSLLIKISN